MTLLRCPACRDFPERGSRPDHGMCNCLFQSHKLTAGRCTNGQIESEGITENVKHWRTDVVSSITSALPMDKLMFEAAEPAVFQYVIRHRNHLHMALKFPFVYSARYYVQNFGPNVNVFVDHSQIVQLACVRKGIWGKTELFNRVVTFQND